MENNLLIYSAVVFAASLFGAFVAFGRRWSHAWLHLFVSFAAGVFLGTVFLHLLPKVFSAEHGGETAVWVLAGFLILFFVERFIALQGEEGYDQSHKVISITAFVGLSVHSLIEGIGLAAGSMQPEMGNILFFTIVTHKAPAAFALAALFVLANIRKSTAFALLLAFSLFTPVGALLFAPLLSGEGTISALTGLTAGSFLYVSTGELLPEVFHTRENRWWKLGLLLAGAVLMGLMGHDSH